MDEKVEPAQSSSRRTLITTDTTTTLPSTRTPAYSPSDSCHSFLPQDASQHSLTESTLQQHTSHLSYDISRAHAPPDNPILTSDMIYNDNKSANMDTIAKARASLSPQPLPDRYRIQSPSSELSGKSMARVMASGTTSVPPTPAMAPLGITSFPSAVSPTTSEQSPQSMTAIQTTHTQQRAGPLLQPQMPSISTCSSACPSPMIAAQIASGNMHPISIPAASTTMPSSILRSPCFFHQRFSDLVDIGRVLEEINEIPSEDYSHSRLMQTATGVREVSKQLQRKPLKRAVRTVMIVTRARDNSLVHMTRELTEWLLSTPRYGKNQGVNVYVDAKLKHSKRFDAPGLLRENDAFKSMLRYWTPDLCWSHPEKFDLVLTLGGDGTVLFTSWLFQRVVPPILSFALGSLGFLTNFEFEKYKTHLNNIMGDGGMRVNLRMRFTCTVWRRHRDASGKPKGGDNEVEEGEQFEVLNELVIDRGPSAYVSNLELYGDDELLTVVQADGCIFSTPTGSTAYSLSAGGSLIHPSIPAILLTPICPHTLSFRPMVLSDTLSLRIAVPGRSRSSAYCSFDGKGRIELKQGDYVTLEASQYPFPTVMTGGNEWVESVQRALRWNVRGAEQRGWGNSTKTEGDDENAGEEEEWDIDIGDSGGVYNGTDSGVDVSENGDGNGGGLGIGVDGNGFAGGGAMASIMGVNGIGKSGTNSPTRNKGVSLLNM